MRKNIVVGNWKMNKNREDANLLVLDVLSQLSEKKVEIVFAPSFVHLYKVAKLCISNNNVSVAAQDCSCMNEGAYTGEVSASMIRSCNAKYVILGHSERRENFQETNQQLKKKIDISFANNLKVIFCCGETLDQRENLIHFDWIKSQLSESLFHLSASELQGLVIAYEPIWAIGTGITATTSQAQEMHTFIRGLIQEEYNKEVADNISILYGGSCNSSNARELFSQEDIDGGLIGGASLDSDSFLKIIDSF